ncbi:hypothetical protein BAUCODRAFT_98506 [Baudoinia panamericana UAMH 10762]|uniref:SNF7 family protein n=1 Tax=Baudoinia panamericana (strain UAMH 10762) TaxID=717646 RepID=M2MZ56_BAUPA|nr:uncharacterized protein BAUCODRAFT_98506 [Baudoinia panamericana UAMH 10762]EMC91959.1 hypothetical protein BAUCODRAFT_98506 [Baudoinia panamericana UAMH 10762]
MIDLLEFLRTHEEAFRSRARLASLYSDFRFQRQTNPDGYQANASAWLRALTAAAKEGLLPAETGTQHDRYVLHTGEALAKALQTQDFGRPLALGSVVEDAVRKKQLVLLQDFLASKQSVYATSWLPTPWQVLSWGLRQVGLVGREGVEDKLVTGNSVIMANVEAAARQILDDVSKNTTSNASRIFSRELFMPSFAAAVGTDAMSTTDMSVLIVHLARDHAAVAYDAKSGTIKFRAPSETAAPTIEQEDISIASLRTLVASLESQTQTLTQRVSELDAKAREAVAKKQLVSAKTALRQKKSAETQLRQRTATLAQLEDVYVKVEQAADQVEIVRVMEASSQTLRSLNRKTGGVEKVQDVMEGLREEMMNADEIQQAIADASAGTVDEGEVDDELEALESAEKQKVDEVERKRREENDAVEVEVTARRLAELDGVRKPDEVAHEVEQASKEGEGQVA